MFSTADSHKLLNYTTGIVSEYKIKEEEDRTEPPVTYSHGKSVFVMGCVKWEGGETLRLQKCRSHNPSMETMREEHEACTAHRPFSICRSVKVTICQWRQ